MSSNRFNKSGERVADGSKGSLAQPIGVSLMVATGLVTGMGLRGAMFSQVPERATISQPVLVQSSVFDSAAYVGVDAGRDGLPGRAWIDDGGDGVVDDRGELGATGSDDRLRVLTADEYRDDPDALPLVLQRGGFVPAGDDRAVDHTKQKAHRAFYRDSASGLEWMVQR